MASVSAALSQVEKEERQRRRKGKRRTRAGKRTRPVPPCTSTSGTSTKTPKTNPPSEIPAVRKPGQEPATGHLRAARRVQRARRRHRRGGREGRVLPEALLPPAASRSWSLWCRTRSTTPASCAPSGCEADLEDAVAAKGCLDGILPQATIMVVSVTASTTAGSPLDPSSVDPRARQLAKNATEAAEAILRLDAAKASILRLVEARMGSVAPNLSRCAGRPRRRPPGRRRGRAGGAVAAPRGHNPDPRRAEARGRRRRGRPGPRELGQAVWRGDGGRGGRGGGGLARLRLRLRAHRAHPAAAPHQGRAARRLQGRPARARRRLAQRESLRATTPSGRRLREAMLQTIARWQEPPPARTAKVLPVPDEGPKKRRGGRRARAMKERFGLTDVRQAANRVAFGHAEEEVTVDDETVGLGMLGGRSGGGGVCGLEAARGGQGQQGDAVGQAAEEVLEVARARVRGRRTASTLSLGGAGGGGASGSVSGLASSLAFTPVQGIELVDPARAAAVAAAAADKARGGTESYFSSLGGFKSARPQPPK